MQNREAKRYARWSALIALLLGVAVAGIYLRRSWQARQAEQATPPAVPASVEQRAAVFSFSKETGNQTEFTVRASHATQFKEGGRALLEDVWITAYGQAGDRFDNLHTRSCDYTESTGSVSCAGDVQIDLESAGDAKLHPGTATRPNASASIVHVSTSRVVFNRQTGIASTDQHVSFRFPQGEGSGIGLVYDSAQGELHLVRDVEILFQPAVAPDQTSSQTSSQASPQTPAVSSSGPSTAKTAGVAGATSSPSAVLPSVPSSEPLDVTGSSLLYSRDERIIHLAGPVKAHRGVYELTAGKLDVELDEQLRGKRIVAEDHPKLFDAGAAAPITVAANRFSAVLSADGWIERVDAMGSVHAEEHSIAARDTMDAEQADLDFSAHTNQPRHLTAIDKVAVDSTRPGGVSRRMTTSRLDMDFAVENGSSNVRIARATTPEATMEWSGPSSVSTTAVLGTDSSKGGGSGKEEQQQIHLASRHFEATFGKENELRELTGTGDVRAGRRIGSAAPQISTSREMAAHFDPGQEWSTVDQSGDVHLHQEDQTAQADRAHFERLSDTVALMGSVIVADAGSRTTAESATLNELTHELRAEGRVATSELSKESNTTNLGAGPAHISGDHLAANTATGHAVYSGHARLWQGDSVVQADSIELDRTTRVLTAINHVQAIFPQARWTPERDPAASHLPAPPQHTAAHAGTPAEYWRVEAGRLTYASDDSSSDGSNNSSHGGRARLEQDVRAHSNEGSMRSDSMELFFAPQGPKAGQSADQGSGQAGGGGQQLVRAIALGNVVIDQEERQGTGDKGEYTASEGKFVLSGGPPKVHDESGNSTTGRQLTLFFADDNILIDSAEGLRTLTMHRVEK